MSKWGKWHEIDDARSNEIGCFGIYQIRIVDKTGNPIPVPRILGLDKEGIVYVGRSGYDKQRVKRPRTLAQRIWEFQSTNHSGASTYVLMRDASDGLAKHPHSNHRLQYRAIHLNADSLAEGEYSSIGDPLLPEFLHKRKIEKCEVEVLSDYFAKFGELPPCNSSFPKWKEFVETVHKNLGRVRL